MDGRVIVLHTTPEQEERLKKLLSWHRNHTDADGNRPHRNWFEAELLECLVNIHAKNWLSSFCRKRSAARELFRKRKRARHKSLTLNRIRIRDKISIRHTAEKVKFYKGLAAV